MNIRKALKTVAVIAVLATSFEAAAVQLKYDSCGGLTGCSFDGGATWWAATACCADAKGNWYLCSHTKTDNEKQDLDDKK